MRIRGLRRHTTTPDQGPTAPTHDEPEHAELVYAARDYLLNYGWWTIRGRQSLHLAVDDELVALLVPMSSAPRLDALLLTAGIVSPVIEIPGTAWAFLAGHEHGTARSAPTGTTLLTGTDIVLPPTQTSAGQARWARHPDDATVPPIADILRSIGPVARPSHDQCEFAGLPPVAIGSLIESR